MRQIDLFSESELNKQEPANSDLGTVSGSQICPNCEKEHDSDEWNGYCSKICWWGFPVDYRCYVLGGLSALNLI